MRLPKFNLNFVSFAVIGAAIVLLIAGILYYSQQERQRVAINGQTESTNQLIKEVKRLSEENKQLNQENKDYAYCTAQLIARYTRDQAPITIDDLRTCALTSFPSGQEPRAVNGDASNTVIQEVLRQDGSVEEINRPTGQPVTNNTTNTTNNTNNTVNDTEDDEDQLLELNAPCIKLPILNTCRD